MTNYEIIGGHMVKDRTNKEELLDIIINIMSSRGETVVYSTLKTYTAEKLVEKLEKLNSNYNCIVYEYDINNNCTINKGNFFENRTLKYAGKTIIIESKQSFIANVAELVAEENYLEPREESLYKELTQNGK